MQSRTLFRLAIVLIVTQLFLVGTTGSQEVRPRKVYMVTDMEGVDGIFNWEDQCDPFKSPRWAESQQLLTDEVNAAVDGLIRGGATEVVVADMHNVSRSLSVATIDARARLLQGRDTPPTQGLDNSYSALVFIGQHAMAGAPNGILSHSYGFEIQNMWVNNKLVGEIGGRTMLAGYFGVPVIMLSGDAAACDELHDLVPSAECAEVKKGLSRTAGIGLSHAAARDLIREKSQRAMERLGQFHPYHVSSPTELKIEFTVEATPVYRPREGVERLNERTYIFRGKDIVEAWLKWGDF
jgi:D-amino peptidase